MSSPFEGDALATLILETLTDRGVPYEEAVTALEESPPDWDRFAMRFIDPYENETQWFLKSDAEAEMALDPSLL